MTRITGEIVIDAPAEVVFDFVADQRNEPAYNPHMVRSAKVTPGPVGKGTQFRSAVRSRGRLAEMAIKYTGFQRPSRLASTTTMAQAEFSGTLTFEPAGAGTRLRWSWDARFAWPLRLLAPVLARVGGRQERATWAGLKRYLESSQHAAAPGAGEQPGVAPAAPADGNGSQPPGQGRAGAVLLAASVAGVAFAPLALRRLGRGGSLLVAAGCGALFARDAQMTLTGALTRLRPLPRLLLRSEVPLSGSAAGAALLACWQQQPGVARVAAAAAAATFAVHAVREAIYLSPGHGSEEPAAQ
jgi:carbon monoxide dehydrogenase subunit G